MTTLRPPSDKVTRYYATCQELYRLYTELWMRHEHAVNFPAMLHALMDHPELSRITKLLGNNFDQYMTAPIAVDQLRQLHRYFNEVFDAYDHTYDPPLKLPEKLSAIEVFWICIISHETMDFDLPFIRMGSGLLLNSLFNFLMAIQEAQGDLMEADAKTFDDTFATIRPNPGMPATIRMTQLLWDAMTDRDVAEAYEAKYMKPKPLHGEEPPDSIEFDYDPSAPVLH